MSQSKVQSISKSELTGGLLNDYLMLIKMRLTSLVVFTAVASFLIAANLEFTAMQILLLGLGGFGVAGASNALNQALEKDYDIIMKLGLFKTPIYSLFDFSRFM